MLLYRGVNILFEIIQWMILARVIISWIPVPRDNKFIILLYQLTEPILGPIRTMIARSSFGKNMMLDFSPIVALLLLSFLKSIILRILFVYI